MVRDDINPFQILRSGLRRAEACDYHPPLSRPDSIQACELWWKTVEQCSPASRYAHLRWLCLNDLYFFGAFILHRWWWLGDDPGKFPDYPRTEMPDRTAERHAARNWTTASWYYNRCREYESQPWRILDIWCYSDDTEVLTRRGWLQFDETNENDEFATRSPEGEFQWQRATARIRRPYVGRMVRLYSKNLGDFLVTPNHRILLKGQTGNLRVAEAQELLDKGRGGWKIPVTSQWRGVPIPEQTFDGIKFAGKDFCAFMGMFLAEGSVRHTFGAVRLSHNRGNSRLVSIAQRPTSKGYRSFRDLLSCIGFKVTYSGGNFQFTNESLATYLRQFGTALDKSIPEIIMNATAEEIAIFLHYFWLGDGSGQGRLSHFYTSSKILADQLCELLQKTGDSGAVIVDNRVRSIAIEGGSRFLHSENPNYCVTQRRSKEMNFNLQGVQYSGNVVCVSVPNGTLLVRRNGKSIWSGNSRESGKSEILTFAANIQSLLKDPNESIGIMSHSRPIAKYFLHLIMRELENNEDLKGLFPDILWSDPKRQAQPWGEDVGIVIRRKTNRRESSIEAWGLIDGQPTGKRYTILSYDDVIARQETTIHMIPKATEEFRNSLILSASSGDDPIRFRYAGTFQELGDTNQQLIDAGFDIRLRPSVAPDGSSLCLPDTRLAWFRAHLTAKEWALQFLLDPSKAKDDSTLGFRTDWIQYYEKPNTNLSALTKYIFVDPAGPSPDTNSHYVLVVVGLSPDKRKKVIDLVYDKLNLDDRTKVLKHYATKYQVLRIFYEKAAMQADIEHIRGEMRRELWECPIFEVGDNQVKKDQRIEWLLPEFSEGIIQLPKDGIPYRIQSPDLCRHLKLPEGSEVDLCKLFIEREYDKWPTSQFKDILDALSWLKWGPIQNMLVFPRPYGMDRDEYQVGGWGIGDASSSGGWMTG